MKKIIIQKGMFIDKMAYIQDGILQKIGIVNKEKKYFEKDVFVVKKKRKNISMKSSEVSLDGEVTGFIQESKNYDSDIMLCQIKKIFASEKNPKISSEITLTGRYVVYIGGSSGLSISNKAMDKAVEQVVRERIEKNIISRAKIIIRSNARDEDIEKILDEIEEFEGIYDEILQKSKLISKPQMIYRQYESEELFLSKINTDIDSVVINDRDFAKILEKSRFAPKQVIFEDNARLFTKYGIDTQINTCLGEKVILKNRINIFIQSTQAMSIIDVNSAGYVKYNDFSQNAYHVNHLVCDEIARQIRLRDIAGVILIDFIDMNSQELSEKLREHLIGCLNKDDRKSTVSILSRSDIFQIIRKKEDISLEENLTGENIRLLSVENVFEDVNIKIANVIREGDTQISIDIPIFESEKANNYISLLEKKYNVKIRVKYLKKDDFNIKIKVEK